MRDMISITEPIMAGTNLKVKGSNVLYFIIKDLAIIGISVKMIKSPKLAYRVKYLMFYHAQSCINTLKSIFR